MKPKTDWIEKRQAPGTDADRMRSNLSPTATAPRPADVIQHASRRRMAIGHQLPRIRPRSFDALTVDISRARTLRKHAA